MPPRRVRKPPRRLVEGSELNLTERNVPATPDNNTKRSASSDLPVPKAKKPTMSDISETLSLLQKQQSEFQIQLCNIIAQKSQVSENSSQELNVDANQQQKPSSAIDISSESVLSNQMQNNSAKSVYQSTSKGSVSQQVMENLTNPMVSNIDQVMPDQSGSESDSDLEGECTVQFAKQRPVFSGGLTVSQTIPQKIKLKIWQHKFIDFVELLNPHNMTPSYSVSLNANSLLSDKPALMFQPKSKKQLNEFEWNQAWDSYMSVYLKRYPEQLDQMLTYHQHIQRMMARQANWRDYDYHFRVDREYVQFDWDIVRPDLERDAYNSFRPYTKQSGNPSYKTSSSTQSIPKGYCFAYNTIGKRCVRDNCSFKHVCPECQNKHPKYQHGKPFKPSSHANSGQGGSTK